MMVLETLRHARFFPRMRVAHAKSVQGRCTRTLESPPRCALQRASSYTGAAGPACNDWFFMLLAMAGVTAASGHWFHCHLNNVWTACCWQVLPYILLCRLPCSSNSAVLRCCRAAGVKKVEDEIKQLEKNKTDVAIAATIGAHC